jgi:hypothetical protein
MVRGLQVCEGRLQMQVDDSTRAVARSVLNDTLPVVHRTLVLYYRFMEEEAEAFEDVLTVWFHRLARRLTGRAPSSQELREQLLFVSCKYARAFQIAKFRGLGPSQEEELTLALARSPEEVAIALSAEVKDVEIQR